MIEGQSALDISTDGDTCSFCAADEDGMVVWLISSIYHDFGSTVVGEGTGIVLQNRGSFFSLDETIPTASSPASARSTP